jgi:hypothetical protein
MPLASRGRSCFDRASLVLVWRLLDVRDKKPGENDGIAASERLRADDFDPGIMRQLYFPTRGLVALATFHRFRSPDANGVAPSQFDATRSGKDQLTGHSIVRAPLYGRTPVLTKARQQRVARDAVTRRPLKSVMRKLAALSRTMPTVCPTRHAGRSVQTVQHSFSRGSRMPNCDSLIHIDPLSHNLRHDHSLAAASA